MLVKESKLKSEKEAEASDAAIENGYYTPTTLVE